MSAAGTTPRRLRLVTLLCLFASLLAVPTTRAHEARPAYLEITETSPNQFSVLWRTPVLAGMRLRVVLTMPGDVKNLKEPVVQELADSLLERRWIDAGPNGLAGKQIQFTGLQLTITDVLRARRDARRQNMDNHRPSFPAVGSDYCITDVVGSGWLIFAAGHRTHIGAALTTCSFYPCVDDSRERHAPSCSYRNCLHSCTQHHARGRDARFRACAAEACRGQYCFEYRVRCLRDCACAPGLAGLDRALAVDCRFYFWPAARIRFRRRVECSRPSPPAIPVALLFFNVGVEIGQLLFIAAILSIMALGRWLIRRTAIPEPAWAPRAAPVQHRRCGGLLDDSTHRGILKKLLALVAIGETATGSALLIVPSLVVRLLFDPEIAGVGVVMSRLAGIASDRIGSRLLAGPAAESAC